jgi:hypothetical protein
MEQDGLLRAERNVGQVMSSIGKSDVTQLKKSLDILRQNAHQGLEHLFEYPEV